MDMDVYRCCTEIANEVLGGPPPNCTSQYAKRWQAAWDAACIAFGDRPEKYRLLSNAVTNQ